MVEKKRNPPLPSPPPPPTCHNDSVYEDSFDDFHNEKLIEADDSLVSEDESSDKYMLMINQEQNVDKIYGIRKENDKLFIGNSPVSFENNYIIVKDVKFPKTQGLMELLILKNPNNKHVSFNDLQNYRSILDSSSAHRKQFKEDEAIRTHNSNKYTTIISRLFKSGDGLLPRYKVARKNSMMDYVYWDDPNELCDRLRLLIAERAAGNQSHINEIHSIIEELRESGYIY